MRSLMTIGLVANLVLAAVSLILAPGTVAVHFGAGGEPDGWGSANANALFMAGINLLLFGMFYFMPRLVRVTPQRWVNLPNKDYWFREENKARMMSALTAYLDEFGFVMFAFLFLVGLLAMQANLSQPVHLREDLMWWALGLLLVYTAWWLTRFMRAFRIPRPSSH